MNFIVIFGGASSCHNSPLSLLVLFAIVLSQYILVTLCGAFRRHISPLPLSLLVLHVWWLARVVVVVDDDDGGGGDGGGGADVIVVSFVR